MIKFQPIDDNQYKKVILHYKRFYISICIILVCLVLLITVILPQIQQYVDQRGQIQEMEERIFILTNNLEHIKAIDDQNQLTALQTTLSALPQDKDYAGILYAVQSASAKAGVGVGDFSFSVGELSSKSIISKNVPFLSLNLRVNGPPTDTARFISQLSQTMPLSNISDISLESRSSVIIVQFYYKPIPSLKINYAQPLKKLTTSQNELLQKLSEWKAQDGLPESNIFLDTPASSSASPFSQ